MRRAINATATDTVLFLSLWPFRKERNFTVSITVFASVGRWFETRLAACSSDRTSDDIRPYTKSVTDLIVGAVCLHFPTKSLYFGGFVSTMQKKQAKTL